MVNKAWEIQKIQRHWMNNAIGCIIVLLLSIITFFLNLESLQLSVITMLFCFVSVIGAKISFARADFHAKNYNLVLERLHVMAESGVLEQNSRENEVLLSEVTQNTLTENSLPTTEDIFIDEMIDVELTNVSIPEYKEDNTAANNVRELKNIQDKTSIETTVEIEQKLVEVDSNNKLHLDASSIEDEVFNKVQCILESKQRDVSQLSAKRVGNYLDIMCQTTLLRLKLNGRKKYILSNLTQEQVDSRGLIAELPSKNENYKTRIVFTSLDIIEEMEDYLLEQYDLA